METPTKRTKVHTRYYLSDGPRVPGVTTILGVLAKPALIPWANRMGLAGIDTSKYVDEKAEIGTCCHYMIECDVKGETPDLSDYSPNTVAAAENGYLKWLDWKPRDFELVGSEMALISEEHRYGGTIDILARTGGKLLLVDIKTSGSGIWPEMKHQVVAYDRLLKESGHVPDELWILRVGRDETEGFEAARIGNEGVHWRVFLACRDLYDLQKIAK